ncbi:MAG: PAM68 family protein [Elainellaceae cyanobacterium]
MASPLGSNDQSKERSSKERLPFEPRRSQKKAERTNASSNGPDAKSANGEIVNAKPAGNKRTDAKAAKVQAAKEKLAKMQRRSAEPKRSRRGKSGIPEVVSRRMIKRMAILSGTPMALGVGMFFASYYIVIHDLFPLPTIAVLFVSLGFFGLSVLGLTYGVLSASWEETSEPGSFLGWDEFRLNFDRARSSWQGSKSAKP